MSEVTVHIGGNVRCWQRIVLCLPHSVQKLIILNLTNHTGVWRKSGGEMKDVGVKQAKVSEESWALLREVQHNSRLENPAL